MAAAAAVNGSTSSSSCPPQMTATSNGAWQGDNPLDYALPLIILQMVMVVVLTRSLAFLLRPLRQPRVIAEIIGGILLGPSALGRSKRFADTVFPKQSLTVLDTIANIGLLFFLFLVGLELDLRSLRRTRKHALALALALAGISLPFVMGIGTSVVLRATVSKGVRQGPFLVFMGVALSITAFPVLARILAELKLLTTDIGRMAMSAAAVNDVAAWVLVALAIALSGSGSPLVTLWVLLSAAAFVAAGGILLGPSALGRSKRFADTVFPNRSLTVLDTIANIGLLFFLFLVGLELDLRSLRRTGKRALAIALAGISLPFVMGIGTSVVLRATVSKGVRQGPFLVFMGVALSITAFPVLARILAELKLLTTDIGRMAMSAAAVNDVAAWILLALAIALSGSGSPLVTLWVLLSAAAFVAAVALLVRPILAWMAHRCPDGEPVNESYICATLSIVLAAGFITDTIGIHALFGAFVVGVVVPKDGPFAGVLIEKIEDLVSSLFLPLYFVSSGLKTNVATISGARSWGLLVLVITNACLGKIAGTVLVSLSLKIPPREAVALGFLMNTKGLVELIVLNIGKDRKVLNDETFAIMVLMALFTTFITTPIVMAVYKPARRLASYKHRSIQRGDSESELRILACFHSYRNIPTLINLVESSRGTRRRGVTVYAMHLMELSERSSAISMVHKARRNGLPFWNRRRGSDGNGDQIVVAFETYQQLSSVALRPMTAISDLRTIHEDIVASALQKRAALILLPFHKVQQVNGSLESIGTAYQHVNQRVLSHAPCSVGILVDRGLGGTAQVSASEVSCTVAVLFFGGPDDREALAYGARMAEHPGITVTMVRFLLSEGGGGSSSSGDVAIDEASISEFRGKAKESVRYEERVVVEGKVDIMAAIKEIGRCNLFILGRTSPSPSLTGTNYYPELGAVGSYLVSSESSNTTASVLVIQRYDPKMDPSSSINLVVEEEAEIGHDTPDTRSATVPMPSPPS